MNIRGTVLLCLVQSVLLFCSVASADGLEGAYTIVESKNLKGETYTGSVEITKVGKTYRLAWKTTAGNYRGIGIRIGNVLAVGFGPGGTGVVAYMRDGKAVNGLWASCPSGQLGTEVLTGNATGWAGTWAATGTNPGGKGGYKGTLVISDSNPHSLRWDVGAVYSGVGLHKGDVLAVGWGKGDVGVVHYTIDGQLLRGNWAIPGSRKVGVETLKR